MMTTRVQISILFACLACLFTSPGFAASVSGTVKFDGVAPKFKEIKMDADPICMTANSSAVLPQTLVLGDGNTMGNVFVYVKSGLPNKEYPAPSDPVVIDQKGCMYHPHVAAVMVGQPVKILNPDGTLHNVHGLCKINPEFNAAMPKFRTEITKTFDKPEFMFPLKCDVHPWMAGYLSVMANPFFMTTKEDGKFTIDNLPAGTYEIAAWHERLGTQTQTVTVKEGEPAVITFTFKAPEKKE